MADVDRIKAVAVRVKREVDAGHQVAVVVSAMAGTTNQLVGWTNAIARLHDAREYDAVVAAGEQVTAGLTGARAAGARRQRPLLARLADPDPDRRRPWQGPHPAHRDGGARPAHGAGRGAGGGRASRGCGSDNRITTLGRGGSDTSAVALAAALQADRCDIFTDVDGVYTTDPRIVAKARKLDKITYEEMLEMASLGAKVLQIRSVEMAMKHHVRAAGAVELRRPARHPGRG